MSLVDRIIVSADEENRFFEFWPIVSEAWNKFFPGVPVSLAFVSKRNEADPLVVKLREYGNVTLFAPLPGIPSANQAKISRFALAASCSEQVCMIEDIDTIPLQREYVERVLRQRRPGELLCVGHEVYENTPHQGKFPVSNITCEGELFQQFLNPHNLPYDSLIETWKGLEVFDQKESINNPPERFSDESLLRVLISRWGGLVRKARRDVNIHEEWIDRSWWKIDPKRLMAGQYVTCNFLRPFSENIGHFIPLFTYINGSEDWRCFAALVRLRDNMPLKRYCINLDMHASRWEECCAEFTRIGLRSVHRVSARIVDTPINDSAADHASCIGMSLIAGDPMCMIMEDDFQFITSHWSDIEDTLAELQQHDPEWDILFLGIDADPSEFAISGPPRKLTANLYRVFNCFATHAYIVKNSAYHAILETWRRFAKSGIPHDVVYSRELLPRMRAYCVNPLVALKRPNYAEHQQTVLYHNYLIDRWNVAISLSTSGSIMEDSHAIELGGMCEQKFVDREINIFTGYEAEKRLSEKNDQLFLSREGIVQISEDRWKEAQEYEHKTWMINGLEMTHDHNMENLRQLDNLKLLSGRGFRNAIELGSGPFTNIYHIAEYEYIHIERITILDPLLNSYLLHPHNNYRKEWITINSPIEEFDLVEKYDLVVMINVLEHCRDIHKIFNKITQMISPNGIFVFGDISFPRTSILNIAKDIYNAGHPLRLDSKFLEKWLCMNFERIYSKCFYTLCANQPAEEVFFVGEVKSPN